MKRRPWPFVFLAVFQGVAPVVHLSLNALIVGVPMTEYLRLCWEFYSLGQLAAMLAPGVITGYAIWATKAWSYPVFFAVCAWSLYANTQNLMGIKSAGWLATIIGSYVCNLAFLAYFLLPSVRHLFFDAKMRWWETKPRFIATVRGRFQTREGRVFGFKTTDVAEGGLFMIPDPRGASHLKVGDEILLTMAFHHIKISASARIVHYRKSGRRGFGAQFVDLGSVMRTKMRHLVKAMELLEFENKVPPPPWRADLRDWWVRLVQTGKGITPEFPEPAAAASPRKRASRSKRALPANVVKLSRHKKSPRKKAA